MKGTYGLQLDIAVVAEVFLYSGFRLAGWALLFSLMRKVSKRIKTNLNSLIAQTKIRR
jgi:hypothetical protein